MLASWGTGITDSDMLTQALEMDGVLADLNATRSDFLWAASLAYSRSFDFSAKKQHLKYPMLGPGIDMCNHSFRPNAFPRHGPGAPPFLNMRQ